MYLREEGFLICFIQTSLALGAILLYVFLFSSDDDLYSLYLNAFKLDVIHVSVARELTSGKLDL